jgi:hypothetical protein
LGYKYAFSENISAKITFDGSRASSASAYTVFLKHAQLDWKLVSPVKLSLGLLGLTQFSDQEKFSGYRYVFKSFQDEFSFGSSADLGINIQLTPHEMVRIDAFVNNGEGYKNLQDDYGMHKVGGDILFKPIKGLQLKAYYSANFNQYDKYGNDSIIVDTSTIQNLAFFAGFKREKFRIGAEYNLMLNGTAYNKPAEDHELSGFAVYGTYSPHPKFEIFGQWMMLQSNTLNNVTDPWNYDENGNLVLVGLQYAPVKGIKMALNYRTYIYENSDIDNLSRIYMNFEFAF